jgi:hypothetical protein
VFFPHKTAKLKILLAASLWIMLTPFYAFGATFLSAGAKGRISLTHNGADYLGKGQTCSVVRLTFRQGNSRVSAPVGNGKLVARGAGKLFLSRIYNWGAITCNYFVVGDQLRTNVAVTNRTNNVIDEIRVQLINLRPPDGEITRMHGSDRNLGGPDVIVIPYSEAKLFAANEQVARPLDTVPLLRQGSLVFFLDSDVDRPKPLARITRAIPPGGHDSYLLSFRFAGLSETMPRVMSDLFRRWSERFPDLEDWPDRRPIGFIELGGHGSKTPGNPLNPGYWNFVDRKLDINSEAGRQSFRKRLFQWIDASVANLKHMNAQGAIIWDIEGEQYSQPDISYIGDTRYLRPEMKPLADEVFRRFTRAGLRCGVTLRPQGLVMPETGTPHRINSMDPDFLFNQLDQKLTYTQKKFGCTLFYVDSNGTTGWGFDWEVFRRLHAKHPDVLVVPEHKTIVYYTVTAPYCDARIINYDCPSVEARWLYPRAFSVINLSGGKIPKLQSDMAALVNRAAAGDIFMAQVWYDNPQMRLLESIEQRAPNGPGSGNRQVSESQ